MTEITFRILAVAMLFSLMTGCGEEPTPPPKAEVPLRPLSSRSMADSRKPMVDSRKPIRRPNSLTKQSQQLNCSSGKMSYRERKSASLVSSQISPTASGSVPGPSPTTSWTCMVISQANRLSTSIATSQSQTTLTNSASCSPKKTRAP